MVTQISVDIKKKEFFNTLNRESSHIAIKKLKLKVLKGQFCSIIGPSGCGKSTLLNLISGLDKSFDGAIKFNRNKKVEQLRVSYMFQTPRLLPWLNVLQNVEVVLSKAQIKESKSKEFLSLMGLEKFLDYFPNKLSGGMQRRVALARSFAVEPELLILDEPFVSLDEPAANLLRNMLLDLWSKQPTTVIFVTHNISEAIYLADKIIFLSKSPARVLKEVNINNTRPRNSNSESIQKIKKSILKSNSSILKGEI
ncbi:MAG: ABC transporter [Rickettsiales bacterium]|nr:ABC transporter [Rickettsiales bacterium]OUV78988.1 MAG: hypothetical protein CBC91_04400 [Rickettsiales bacterium TMED131]